MTSTSATELTTTLSSDQISDIHEVNKNLLKIGYKELSKLFTNLNPSLLLISSGELIRTHSDVGYVKYYKYLGNLQITVSIPLEQIQRDQLEYAMYLEEEARESQEQQEATLYNVDEESTS